MAKSKRRKKRQDSWRFPNRNRHHIKPVSRFKEEGAATDNSDSNLLLLRLKRHHAWHMLFGDKTLEEAIALLLRLHRAKGGCVGLITRCLLEAQHDSQWESVCNARTETWDAPEKSRTTCSHRGVLGGLG